MRIEIEELTEHVSGTGDFILIDNSRCTKCDKCLQVCLVNLWHKKENAVYISHDYREKCLECAACYQVCEAGAISFQYPRGGTGIIYKRG